MFKENGFTFLAIILTIIILPITIIVSAGLFFTGLTLNLIERVKE